jgi:hypothetical protein
MLVQKKANAGPNKSGVPLKPKFQINGLRKKIINKEGFKEIL